MATRIQSRFSKRLDKNGVFYIHARDSSSDTLAGAADDYWRALFDVNGRNNLGLGYWPEGTPDSARKRI